MADVEELRWEDLTVSARRALLDVAAMFHDGGAYDVEVFIREGGCRDVKLRTDPDSWRRRRTGDP